MFKVNKKDKDGKLAPQTHQTSPCEITPENTLGIIASQEIVSRGIALQNFLLKMKTTSFFLNLIASFEQKLCVAILLFHNLFILFEFYFFLTKSYDKLSDIGGIMYVNLSQL